MLLIGGTGFAGCHMQELLDSEYKVMTAGSSTDIRDFEKVMTLIRECRPDYVVNLASITTVKESFANPFDTYDIGVYGTLNLLISLKQIEFKGRMLNISSSEVYGHPDKEQLPITEDLRAKPLSPYAVNKISTEALCYQWSQSESFEIVTARPFTHIGPGQSERFSISNFAKQIAEIMIGKRESVIYVGNINTTRDFTDVRDVVCAYRLLLLKGKNGSIYNICSGKEISISYLLNKLIQLSNMNINIETDKSLFREKDQQFMLGSHNKINTETNWTPSIDLDVTLNDTLRYWVNKIKNEK